MLDGKDLLLMQYFIGIFLLCKNIFRSNERDPIEIYNNCFSISKYLEFKRGVQTETKSRESHESVVVVGLCGVK